MTSLEAAEGEKGVSPGNEVMSSRANEKEFDSRATKRLVRKLDLALLPVLTLLYLLSFLDRSNIGNARLAGLEKDLHMNPEGLQYNVALSIFFPFYVLIETPSNLIMKRFRPSLWIPTIMVAWGTMCCLMGAVHNYAGLLAVRAALGFAEGGLFPGINFYITVWYKRHECGQRMAIFFSAATIAGAFGGLLARGIVELDGRRGLGGWAWIFIIEGAITVVVALLAYFLLHDYPDTASFLTREEKHEVQRRLQVDHMHLDDEFRIKYFWDALRDWKIWVHMVSTIGIFTPLYAFSLFLPTIIKNMGYKDNAAQLMSVPPYFAACLFCIAGGWIADRTRQRGIYQIGFNVLAMLGFSLQFATTLTSVKYLGTFFAASGIYSNVPQCIAWNSNNIGGATKRSVGLAMQIGFGNLGGVISGFMFTTPEAPHFFRGHGTCVGLLAMSTCLSCGMTVYYRRENARRDEADEGMGRERGEWSREEMEAERGKGDMAGFLGLRFRRGVLEQGIGIGYFGAM